MPPLTNGQGLKVADLVAELTEAKHPIEARYARVIWFLMQELKNSAKQK